MRLLVPGILGLLLVGWSVGCDDGGGGGDTGADADTDTDTDVDTDTDADTDTDTDADTDTDTDADTDSDSDADGGVDGGDTDTGTDTGACIDPLDGAPEVTSTLTVALPWGTTSDSYTLSFDEAVFGVDTSTVSWTVTTGSGTLDSITPVDSSTYTVAFSGLADGDSYTLTVTSDVVDTCDNPVASTEIAITVETCTDPVEGAPAVTSSTLQTYPVGTTSGSYTLTFSEAVSGVDTSSVTWTATTGAGTLDSVTEVDASTYTVAFSGVADGDEYTITVGTAVLDSCATALAAPVDIDIAIETPVCELDQDFSSWPPTGWSVVDGGTGSEGFTWFQCDGVTCVGSDFVSTTFTLADGAFAAVDSDAAGSGSTSEEELITPELNCSAVTSVMLYFDHAYNHISDDYAAVQVSVDGGSNWTDAVVYNADVIGAGESVSLDLSSLAAGETSVMVRFFYYATWDWHWLIDSVQIVSS